MQATEDGAEPGAAICPDLLSARWGEQAPSTVVDRGPCEAFLPCLSWAAEIPGERLSLLAIAVKHSIADLCT